MKAFAVWVLGSVLVPALALGAQGRVELNTISSVQVRGATVEITGSRKPNFTTFTMSDPPRLIIDISEAVFAGVPGEIPVGDGTMTAIRTASYGSDASAIARVLVGFERDVETDLRTSGNTLVVRVGGAQAPPAARTNMATGRSSCRWCGPPRERGRSPRFMETPTLNYLRR